MKYKIKSPIIIVLIILATLPLVSTNAIIDDDSKRESLQVLDDFTAPIIFFDLNNLLSDYMEVVIYEPDEHSELAEAEVYINEAVYGGNFSYVPYVKALSSPYNYEATPTGDSTTYTSEITPSEVFNEEDHTNVTGEGFNTDGVGGVSTMFFCDNRDCWAGGPLPLSPTNEHESNNLQITDHLYGPHIFIDVTEMLCCHNVTIEISDPAGVVDVDFCGYSFFAGVLEVSANNTLGYVTTIKVDFGSIQIDNIILCVEGICGDESCERTSFPMFVVLFSILAIIPIIYKRRK